MRSHGLNMTHDIKFFAAIKAEIDEAYLTGRGRTAHFRERCHGSFAS